MSHEETNQKEALHCGLAILGAKWTGKSDFDKGMRLLQKALGLRKARRTRKAQ